MGRGPSAPGRGLVPRAPEAERRDRLVARHVAHGRAPAEAEAWVREVDEPNAGRVRATRPRADLVVRAG